MISIKIDDILFSHCDYSSLYQKSKYIIWDRTPINNNDDIVIYTDCSLKNVNSKVKTKIGWLLESPAVTRNEHRWIKHAYDRFDLILTHSKNLITTHSKFKFCPTGGCWINSEDHMIYEKSKNVSIIASSKAKTDGHKFRQTVIQRNFNNLDVYGKGYAEIDYKLKGLSDYRFSIVIENTKEDYYFTEKLIDCFVTGTIPIYWGCPYISKFFNEHGIITFNNLNELEVILSNLSEDLYQSKLDNIIDNFNRSKEYIIAEDYMYDKYIKDYFIS